MRTQGLSPQRPVQEVDSDKNEDECQDPGPVFLRDCLADLAGFDGGLGVKDGQAEGKEGGEEGQGKEGG